jgi:hypothetical protein
VAAVVGRAAGTLALEQRQHLVAHADQRVVAAALANSELEQAAVELERLIDVADLQRDVINADDACALHRKKSVVPTGAADKRA